MIGVIACTTGAKGLGPNLQHGLTAHDRAIVDRVVSSVMHADAVPAVSLAIVRNGVLSYVRAYGLARLPAASGSAGAGTSAIPATIDTRFPIGSVSKEFAAAAILVLADRGRLSLDDAVGKYLPELGHSDQVTIREVLSHISGYRDYLTQEYMPQAMQHPTTPDAILRDWTALPLDFTPGSDWQYSSTNYTVAGRIIERITGQPYQMFLADSVLRPAGISDAGSVAQPVSAGVSAVGYDRFALGPPRPAPIAGVNWLFAAADLDMTARDVANWDIAVMDQTLLSASATRAMETNVRTTNGRPAGYGLGFFIADVLDPRGRSHVLLHHPGEIWGFRAHNYIIPDARTALVVLTNAEYSNATAEIARRLQGVLGMRPASPAPARARPSGLSAEHENAVEARARKIMMALAQGTVDREALAPDAVASFTPIAVSDIRASLARLGRLRRVTLVSTQKRGGMAHHALKLAYELGSLQVAEYDLPSGKIEQFFIDEDDR